MSKEISGEPAAFSFSPPPGGDVSLKSVDNVVFLAHSALLGLASSVFSGMFCAQTRKNVIELLEDAESVSLMLRFIYPPAFLSDLPIPMIEKCLHIAQKYDIEGIITTIDYIISHPADDHSPLRVNPGYMFSLGASYGLHETRRAAVKLIQPWGKYLRDPEDVIQFAKSFSGHASVVGLLGAHSVRARSLFELLIDIEESSNAPIASYGPYNHDPSALMMCSECFYKIQHEIRPGMNYCPPWLQKWGVMAFSGLVDKPLDQCDHLFELSSLDQLRDDVYACHPCLDAARDLGYGEEFKEWANEVKERVKEIFDSVEPLYNL